MANPTVNTGTCNSWKNQLFMGGHCFLATTTMTGNCTTTNNIIQGLASTANIAVGMLVTSPNTATNTFVSYIINSSAIGISNNSTSSGAGVSLTFTADTLKLALIAFTGATATNYTGANVSNYNSISAGDEVSGAGYTAGGLALVNVSPAIDAGANAAYVTFGSNPSWTTATINTIGCIIYNNGVNLLPRFGGGAIAGGANAAVSCHYFGGAQQVTAGTLTLTLPATGGNTAILQIH